MNDISIQELKKLQIMILRDVASFCEQEQISYFLAYGTALGAVRHHGFIPWDDDIDIMMPRPDYERFLALFNKKHQSYYHVYSFPADDNYSLPFAKVGDTRTDMFEFLYKKDDFGVYIDIFPLDGIQGGVQIRQMKFLSMLLNTKKALLGKHRSLLKNSLIVFGKIILFAVSKRRILKKMNRISNSLSYEKASNVCVLCSTTAEREIFDKRLFTDYVYVPFENYQFRVPSNYDQYLKQCYGDYMTLPSEEERQSTHLFKAWWKEL